MPPQSIEEISSEAAYMDSFRQTIFEDKPGVWPDWVYEARLAVKRQDDSNCLPDLLAALEWDDGTMHQALSAVRRMVGCEKEREPRQDFPKTEKSEK